MSSRNVYLTPDERGRAPQLSEALRAAGEELRAGVAVVDVEARGHAVLADAGFGPIDYFEVRDARDLTHLGPGALATGDNARIFGAARMGKARLIDNLAV
jgi:pantoate--beta-alanine ligase